MSRGFVIPSQISPPIVAAAGALVFLGSASPSAEATATIDSVFSATYQNYLIKWNLVASTAAHLLMQMRTSAPATETATNYNNSSTFSDTTAASTGTQITSAVSQFGLVIVGGYTISAGTMMMNNPFAAAVTMTTYHCSGSNGKIGFVGQGYYSGATSYSGVIFSQNTGTMTGDIRVYGISNS